MDLLKTPYVYWANILLLFSFGALCIGIGSVDTPEAKDGLQIGEQICQGIFLLLFVMRLVNWQQYEKLWLAIDLLTVTATFIGIHLQNQEVAKYFQAVRTFRIAFLIKEIEGLNEQMHILVSSVKKASNVLVPALCLLYVYAAVGLYSFSGTFFII